MSAPELPLHRSLLRAAVLAPLVALPAAALTGALRDDHIAYSAFVNLALAWTAWLGVMVLASDIAAQGSWLRRGLVLVLAPALLPFAILCPVLLLERGPLGRKGAWDVPVQALDLLRGEQRGPGEALILASLLPFAAVVAARACGKPRSIAAHAAVIVVPSYASLLLLEHLSSDVALPLELGRAVLLLALPGSLLLLTFLEARLGVTPGALRGLAGRTPPFARTPTQAGLIALGAFLVALALSGWTHPAHFTGRVVRRIRAGDRTALLWDLLRRESQGTTPTRLQRALDSPWPGERRAAFQLIPTIGLLGLARADGARRAIAAAERDEDLGARVAAIRCLAIGWWAEERDRVVTALGEAARDPDPLAAAWARVGLALAGEGEHPDDVVPLIAPLPMEERRELGVLLARYRTGYTASRMAVVALVTAGEAAQEELEEAVDRLSRRGLLPPPSPELTAALQESLKDRDPGTIPAPLAALAELDGPP